jgi:UDP-GlcNAc:undecaprenyl-phosphate/decaprenyl-phosphate GlcNAc-1-phosphate transferase
MPLANGAFPDSQSDCSGWPNGGFTGGGVRIGRAYVHIFVDVAKWRAYWRWQIRVHQKSLFSAALTRMTLVELIFCAAASASITFFLCVRALPLCQRLKLMDVPAGRKTHRAETPLMGGLAILGACVPISIAAIALYAPDRWLPSFSIWLSAVAMMALVGIADDRHSLSPRARLVLSFLIFGTTAAIDPTFNVRILDFEHPSFALGLGTWWLAVIFTVICLVGLVNAVNMADGKNGLVIGLCLGWLLLLASRAPSAMGPLFVILAIVLTVLLIFNLMGKLFLGDGGAYGIACAIGMMAIMTYNSPGSHALRSVSADELVILFIVPVLDSFRLTYRRLRQGRSPMDADRDHLHHHLQDKFGWPAGLIIYWMLALAPATAMFHLA